MRSPLIVHSNFVATKNSKKKPTCSKGWGPCGYRCLPMEVENCKDALTGQAKTLAEWLEKSSRSSAPKSQTQALPKTLDELEEERYQQLLKEDPSDLVFRNGKTYAQNIEAYGQEEADSFLDRERRSLALRYARKATESQDAAFEDRAIAASGDPERKAKLKAFRELYPEKQNVKLSEFERQIPKVDLLAALEVKRKEKQKQASTERRGKATLKRQNDLAEVAFENSPPIIKAAVKKFGLPEIMLPKKGVGPAYFEGQRAIHMDGTKNDSFGSAYRHEWGHYLDHQIGGDRLASSLPKGKAALKADAKVLTSDKYNQAGDALVAAGKAAGLSDYDRMDDTLLFMDLAGATTKNKIGLGHSDEYFEREGMRETEAFANVVSLVGRGIPGYEEAVKQVAPNMYKYVMDLLKDGDRNS